MLSVFIGLSGSLMGYLLAWMAERDCVGWYLLAWMVEGDSVVLNRWIAWSPQELVSKIIAVLRTGTSYLIKRQSTYIGYLVANSIVALVLYAILYGDQELVRDLTTKLMWQNVQSALSSSLDRHGAAVFLSLGLASICWAVKVRICLYLLYVHKYNDWCGRGRNTRLEFCTSSIASQISTLQS